MKRIKVFFLILLVINSTGCIKGNNNQQIIPPDNLSISIQGTWEIISIISNPSETEEAQQQWLGKNLQFSSQYAMVGDELLKNPSYQIKRVNAQEYLFYHFKAFPESFSFSEKEIEVITISEQGLFYCEAFKEKDDELLLKIYNNSFLLKKISEEVDFSIINISEEGSNHQNTENKQEEGLTLSGVLVGLRSVADNEGMEERVYRTLWIASRDKELNPVQEIKDLFFPRRSGFWRLEVKRITEENKSEDFLIAYNILINEENRVQELTLNPWFWEDKEGTIYREINYIGNDYVSIEEISMGNYKGEEWQEKHLSILAVDSLPNIKGVDILDLLGPSGLEAMEAGQQRALGEYSDKNSMMLKGGRDNFGLVRRFGHWFFNGRINYIKNRELITVDYNINIIPPSMLIVYDELYIPWTRVKDKIPGTVDFYTSPNKDIAIVVTKNELMIYAIDEEKLQQEPLERIPLKENETVVMAEWATGHYVENWERTISSFIKDSK